MRKRLWKLVLAGGIAAVVVGGAPAAEALTAKERVAQHRQEILQKIEANRAGRVSAPSAAPAAQAVRGPQAPGPGKVIEVDIGSQTLRAWQDGRVVLQTPVSTGSPARDTPTGRFSVLSKTPRHWSTIYHVWMPWAMRVVGGIFVHEVPLTADGRRIGAGSLGQAVSAGCIRVGVGPAERLYHWANVGTPVLIR